MGQHRRIRESQPAKRAIPLCVGAVLHDPGDSALMAEHVQAARRT